MIELGKIKKCHPRMIKNKKAMDKTRSEGVILTPLAAPSCRVIACIDLIVVRLK